MKKFLLLALPALLLIGITLLFAADVQEHLVRFVFDGDSIRTNQIKKVRYLGLDTPERDEPYYDQAKDLNYRLVANKKGRLEICKKRPLDKHGRTLAYVFVDGKSVTQSLLAAGLARVFDDRDCNAGRAQIHWALAKNAYNKGLGMWADAPKYPIPANKAVLHLDKTRYVTGTVKKVVRTDAAVYANLDKNWRTTGFSIHFPKDDLKRFYKANIQPENLVGNKVVVFGQIKKRKYGPHIICYSPEQIEMKPK